MRTSVALCTALAASFAAGAPIVRVFHIEAKVEVPSIQTDASSPPARHFATYDFVVEKGAPRSVREYPVTVHVAKFHRHHHHGGPRRHNPFMRMLAWIFPPAHHGPRRMGHHSSMAHEEMGGHRRPKHHLTSAELEVEGAKPSFHYVPCRRHGRLHFYRVRKYADMVIVSLVLTFIGVVLLIELWGPLRRLFGFSRSEEGFIRLPDEEKCVSASETLEEKPKVDQKSGSGDDAAADNTAES